ncbi:unnamed protein product [Phyllotreta striolata]|uniref:Actin-binding transcription modulator n=1 Tax=Phyllotreta striolata TaxID=444603 RepID=A0A9N9XLG0_PHYSR|nr:unnamed protein product [Phyllotreta striolata]
MHSNGTKEVEEKSRDEKTPALSLEEKIKQLSVPIVESVSKQHIENFKFFNERHYVEYYSSYCNKEKQYEDMCIRVHTNKLILITLAYGNNIVKSNKNITEIDFVINKGDRSRINLKGKRKLGAKQMHPETVVCKVKLEGEEELRNIRAGVNGYLIEINELIKSDPNLLKNDPKCNGFLAIIMPKGPLQESKLLNHNEHLITEEAYAKLLLERNTT